jgi:small subunit ribosomal protein S17
MVERGHRRREVGLVVGDRADKTISVDVRRLVKHPKYGKYVYRTTRCYAHDEDNTAKKGDRVEIVETRPLSKMKRWRLANVIERASEQGLA